MLTIALVVGMLAATIACVALGERLHLPYPILILVVSAGIAFVPGIPHLELEPEIILPLFLPPLLYATAQHTSWGVFRARWRTLLVLAVGLTAVTALTVAGTAYLLVPTLTVPLALMLGAMVAPPDPVAVEAVAGPARMPRRLLSTLQTEGLFNDAVAIVLFQAALAAVTASQPLGPMIAVRFVIGAVLAVGIGLLIGWLYRLADRIVTSMAARTAISVVAPFAAYMLAETVEASGVIAVVVTALETRRNARAADGELRVTRAAFWNVANLLVTGVAFGLMGVELRDVIAEEGTHLATYVTLAAAVVAVAVVVRLAGMLVLQAVTQRGNHLPGAWRETVVLTWCGMRGLATLALALAIPYTDEAGHAIADRNLMIVLASAVLLATLVPTGLALPWLLRVLRMQDDGHATYEAIKDLGQRAQTAAMTALKERLPELQLPEEEKNALLSRLKGLQRDLAPLPALTGPMPAVPASTASGAGAGTGSTAAPSASGTASDAEADPREQELQRARMRKARDIAVAAQTVALNAARDAVLEARSEAGIDPAAADVVLRRLDLRMMAAPPRIKHATAGGPAPSSRRSAAKRSRKKKRR